MRHRGVELCREIGNSTPLRPFARREVMPGNIEGRRTRGVHPGRNAHILASDRHRENGARRNGSSRRQLSVYGIEGLRIADGSIMPRITTGNTMAPCVVIGERAGDILRASTGSDVVSAHSSPSRRRGCGPRMSGFKIGLVSDLVNATASATALLRANHLLAAATALIRSGYQTI